MIRIYDFYTSDALSYAQIMELSIFSIVVVTYTLCFIQYIPQLAVLHAVNLLVSNS